MTSIDSQTPCQAHLTAVRASLEGNSRHSTFSEKGCSFLTGNRGECLIHHACVLRMDGHKSHDKIWQLLWLNFHNESNPHVSEYTHFILVESSNTDFAEIKITDTLQIMSLQSCLFTDRPSQVKLQHNWQSYHQKLLENLVSGIKSQWWSQSIFSLLK